MTNLPRLIATDLDGTLLQPDTSVSPRTRAALDAARRAGIIVVPVTARQPIGLRAIAQEAGFQEWALCGNAAFCLHLTTGELLFQRTLPVDVQRDLVATLSARIPDLRHVSIRDAGELFVAQEGYAALASFTDHRRDPSTMGGVSLDDVLAAPSLKLVIRHATLSAGEVLEVLDELDGGAFEATTSGAPFVEVMAAGVNKAWGLARLCEHLGVTADEVLAFGDARNDVEMLRWAGRGLAMADADVVVKEAADGVAPANSDDGVAQVIEDLLAAAR
ncbi:HAD family phosphatase [Tessaracoccus rhinocerotis]|uniref:HAD family phosphatase n=1 Tax=Tessaracoccus rhinocerotis TaxID=1689449 RepID=A0A553JXC0_9ACTN|nr:HAD family hydrolase [Tessaracoccus rhinocerotis]TRY17084.1 HAD family phosphatase [Tessaracoccus rhinocerotis]